MIHNVNTNIDEPRIFDMFSPKTLILQIGGMVLLLFRKWLVILLAGFLIGTLAAVYYSFKKTEYLAEITFIIDEEVINQKKTGISQITEELGLGPTDGGSFFNSESNIVALLMSRFLINQTLRDTVLLENKKIIFADFFLDSLDYRDIWMKKSPFLQTDFENIPSLKEEQLFQNSIIGNIQGEITNRMLKVDKKIKGSNIIAVSLISKNELFSKLFLEKMLDNVAAHYMTIQTNRIRTNMDAIGKRNDSIKNAYLALLRGKAEVSDANINLSRQIAVIPAQKKQTEIDILKSAYIELSLSLEAAKTSLLKSTPFIQILDSPLLPLKTIKVSVIKKFIIFFCVGAFVTIVFIILMKIHKHIMSH